MSGRRDWLLQQLGITRWQLKCPIALKGSVRIAPPPGVRLVLLFNRPPILPNPLLQDIFRAFRLTGDQVCYLSADQQITLPETCICWSLDGPPPNNHHPIITSVSLEKLQQSAHEKRQLWQQICRYADYFSTPTN